MRGEPDRAIKKEAAKKEKVLGGAEDSSKPV
jgi:hypothetical protein